MNTGDRSDHVTGIDDLIAPAEPWMKDALCAEPAYAEVVFFPERGDDLEPARAVCAGCAVRVECLALALSSFSTADAHGIWGGLSAKQIRQALSDGATAADAADLVRWERPKKEPKAKRSGPTGDAIEVDPIYCAGCGQPKPVDEFSSARRYCGKACKDAAKSAA